MILSPWANQICYEWALTDLNDSTVINSVVFNFISLKFLNLPNTITEPYTYISCEIGEISL